ncbi:MAG: RagB/SusD family nutrient uptake outer membrane protein, partial [Bacteroidota bacterium]
RENNSLGVPLIYYRTGTIGSEATVYLANGENGGATVTDALPRTFTSPRDYYRPIPFNETVLNPNLTQPFGWQ